MERNRYLDKLIRRRNNGMIKIITGIRRCGKTYLLFELFYNYLIESGVDEAHIIKIALDDRMNKKYRDPDVLCEYVHEAVKDKQMYYVLLDEVQMVSEFEDVLNSFLLNDPPKMVGRSTKMVGRSTNGTSDSVCTMKKLQ